jgi:hypothetical protein
MNDSKNIVPLTVKMKIKINVIRSNPTYIDKSNILKARASGIMIYIPKLNLFK